MKWSPLLHGVSAVAGLLALISVWITQATGEPLLGMDQAHLFTDTQSLFLASITFGVGTMLHMKGEKNK